MPESRKDEERKRERRRERERKGVKLDLFYPQVEIIIERFNLGKMLHEFIISKCFFFIFLYFFFYFLLKINHGLYNTYLPIFNIYTTNCSKFLTPSLFPSLFLLSRVPIKCRIMDKFIKIFSTPASFSYYNETAIMQYTEILNEKQKKKKRKIYIYTYIYLYWRFLFFRTGIQPLLSSPGNPANQGEHSIN